MEGLIGRAFVAMIRGRSGRRHVAGAALDAAVAHPLFGALREPLWLALLTDCCCLASDRGLAERLYAVLLPNAHRFTFLGPFGLAVDLPYSRHLGLLADLLGRSDVAIRHLEDAEARSERAGYRAHLARIRFELARSLLTRARPGDRERAGQLVRAARALAEELGQQALAGQFPEPSEAGPMAIPQGQRPTATATFDLKREGDIWALRWGKLTLRLRDGRGVRLLAELVTSPAQELHVLQLVASGDEPRDAGDAGPVLDTDAVQQYRRRLLHLREEIEDAEERADSYRADKAREEMDFLTRELANAVGLGGRGRRVARAAERARTAVQKRLRETIRRIDTELPELGRHLDQTIFTGYFCGYFPDGRRR
jgi:non-specific serine/threonine protein kinase